MLHYWSNSVSILVWPLQFQQFKGFKRRNTTNELETDLIQKTNEELIREKKKLNSGQEALEGVARLELGMIKPGEQFYVFKEKAQEDSKEEIKLIEPFAVILPSAGQSERFGSDIPKQYCKIDNQLVINYSLDLF